MTQESVAYDDDKWKKKSRTEILPEIESFPSTNTAAAAVEPVCWQRRFYPTMQLPVRPSIHQFVCSGGQSQRERRRREIFFLWKGFFLVGKGRQKGHSLRQQHHTHSNRKPTRRNAHVGCVTESLLSGTENQRPKAFTSFFFLNFFFFNSPFFLFLSLFIWIFFFAFFAFFAFLLFFFALCTVYDDRYLTDGQRTIIRVADKIIALMSSPRWERVEVDNLETISQTNAKRTRENSQLDAPSGRTTKKKGRNGDKSRTQGNNNRKKKNVGGIYIPGLEKQQKITKW